MITMSLSKSFNSASYKIKLLVNYKYLYEFTQDTKIFLNYKLELPNGFPSGRINLIAFIDQKGLINPPLNMKIKENNFYLNEFFYDIPLKVNFPTNPLYAENYYVSYIGGYLYELTGSNFDGKISAVSNLDNKTLNSCYHKITMCDLPVVNFESIEHNSIKLRIPRIIPLIDNENFKNILDEEFKSLLEDPIYENIIQIASENPTAFSKTDQISLIKNRLLDNNPFTSLKFAAANSLLITFTDNFWNKNKNFFINIKKIKIFPAVNFKPFELRNALLQGFSGTDWIDITEIPINFPFSWYTFDVNYVVKHINGNDVKLAYAYEKYRIKTNDALNISEIRIFGNLVFKNLDNENRVICNLKIWDNLNYVEVKNVNFVYTPKKTYFLDYKAKMEKRTYMIIQMELL